MSESELKPTDKRIPLSEMVVRYHDQLRVAVETLEMIAKTDRDLDYVRGYAEGAAANIRACMSCVDVEL